MTIRANFLFPEYPNGSLLFIQPLKKPFIEPGEYYMIQTHRSKYVGRCYYLNDDQSSNVITIINRLQSINIPISTIKQLYAIVGSLQNAI